MRRLVLCLVLAGCSRTTPPMATPDPATVGSLGSGGPKADATTGHALFCAYGGVGIVPSPLPPGYETEFTIVTIELDHPGAAVSGLVVQSIELLNEAGKVAASMRRVVGLVTLDATKAPPGRTESGSWAFFLNPPGDEFDGTLRSGRTRLRIRASLNASPTELLSRVRVTLGGLSTPLVIEGAVWGSWPT